MFAIASALSVSAQSNFNCSIYPRLSVPGDMLPLINMYQGNDSHVEYGNQSNYDFTVACKSNITTIGNNCSGNYINVAQLYNYTDAHVSVDNYYSRMVCFNASSGSSLSWSLQTSAIGATPANYECVFALANYSNSHVYDCDNINATLNVNLRIAQGDINPPTASMEIWGMNGTYLTGSRSVFLNLSYSDDTAIYLCRWANDAESNLNDQPWENCTAVKAWLLSEGYGNKTVYFQVNDTSGNTAIVNDSILYYYTQDYTPPALSVVEDGPDCEDIDWWNSNTTLHACWSAAEEDLSDTVYYKYRVMQNGSCYNNDCNFTDAGTSTKIDVEGLVLYENWLYSFDVVAYVFNTSSPIVSSDGARIDLTPPAAPIVNSSTHPDQARAYALASVALNWTASDVLGNGNRSGIEGYSYLLDQYPGTAPDDVMEERYWEVLKPFVNDGSSQLLRANASVASPHTYAVFSQLHSNFSVNDSVRVRVALAELVSDHRDLMGVKVYLIRHTNNAPITLFDQEANAVSDVVNVSEDIEYAEDLELAEIYTFDLTVNDTVSDVTNDIYIVVSGITADDDNRNNLSIAASSTVDLSAWSFLCNNSNSCANTTASVQYAIEVKKADSGDEWWTEYPGLSDGAYYFHVKAKDRAGNWGDTTHYMLNIAAGGVSVAIVSPEDGQIFTTDTASANISVKVAVSGNASVRVIAKHPDGNSYTSPDSVFSTVHIFDNVTLEFGTNEIYAIANTSAGAVTQSSSVYVIVSRGLVPVTNKTLRVVYGGSCIVSGGGYICYQDEAPNYVGLANEQPGAIAAGLVQADTTLNSIKIFMSKQFSTSRLDTYLRDNEFLDLENPSFSYAGKEKDFVVQNELRYDDVYISGNRNLQPGKYALYITHNGVTPDGRVNLSIEVR